MTTNRNRAGWISTVVALSLLIVVGFLCGALAGFLWEEPGLVFAYLSGETEPVEWSDPQAPIAQEVAPEEDSFAALPVAPERAKREPAKPAPAPDGAVAARPAPAPAKPDAARPPAPEPPAVAAAPPSGFAVQVGAFNDSGVAEQLATRLRASGYDTYVTPGKGSGWRVRVGPVAKRQQAEVLAEKLERGEKLPTWVLAEGEH